MAAANLFSQLPLIFAHRGASGCAPENTLAAFRKAHELGANWVEFDVKLTACGELIVFHDEYLERCTNGHGKVADKTLKQLQTLDAGSWFAAEYAGEKIPSLKQVFEVLAEYNLRANIEIKPNPGEDEATTLKTLELIRQKWPATLAPPLLSSFSQSVCELVARHASELPLGILFDDLSVNCVQRYQQLNAVSLHINQQQLNQETVALLKQEVKYLFAYTVNNFQRLEQLYTWGIDGVFSDSLVPARL